MTSKHTSGPWRVTDEGYISSESQGYVPIRTPFRERAFEPTASEIHTEEELRANARLIASAPDLLAAVKELLIAFHGLPAKPEDCEDPTERAAIETALAAIAKAETT